MTHVKHLTEKKLINSKAGIWTPTILNYKTQVFNLYPLLLLFSQRIVMKIMYECKNININFRVCQDRSRTLQSELKAFGSDLKKKRKSSIKVQKDISFLHDCISSSIMHNAGLLYVFVERMTHNQPLSKEKTHLTSTYFKCKPCKGGDAIILKGLAHIQRTYSSRKLIYKCWLFWT